DKCISVENKVNFEQIKNKTICGDTVKVLENLPEKFADLLIVDPPYNMQKNFHGNIFKKTDFNSYEEYIKSWLLPSLKCLKENASIYVCCDWESSLVIGKVLFENSIVRNRITWHREKGRGAKSNWKNTMEDIWFSTLSEEYTFNLEAVKVRRKVIAPYKIDGKPKDWEETEDGKFRDTCPGNFWDDISVPYWSMKENTAHPTQKPEKLIAKLILASSNEGDVVFDPFLGSGTTSVTAKKLNRNFVGIEQNPLYCAWTEHRLSDAEKDNSIQGFSDGVFWERNSK
ncbi:MAG: site-specific DNA-methyltransferase, partial [Spirochaetaceae bacterium]|nr:site-specific DNA-methyltransferase [Spirochaetaceae bacterium]